MVKIERTAREVLSDWRLWMGVAYFGLAATVIALLVLFNRTAREEAARAASVRAAAVTQVAQCFTSARNAPITDGFIDAHEAIIDNSIAANRAALALSSPADPLRRVREQSLARLAKAKANADQLRRLIFKTTPTISSCVRLANRLRVDASRYTRRNR